MGPLPSAVPHPSPPSDLCLNGSAFPPGERNEHPDRKSPRPGRLAFRRMNSMAVRWFTSNALENSSHMNRMPKHFQSRLQETFTQRRVSMDRRCDVLKSRPHLEGHSKG